MSNQVTYPHAAPGTECEHAAKIGRELVVCGMPAVCVRKVEGNGEGVPLCKGCYEEMRAKEEGCG